MTDDKCAAVAEQLHYHFVDIMFAALGFGDLPPVGVRNRHG